MPTEYTKQTWVNGAAGSTPISAARLNYIEDGIENATVPDGTFPQTDTLEINVAEHPYNAILDGVTDDSVTIQAAVVVAEVRKCGVFIPPTAGGCRTKPIHVATGGIKLRGDNTKIIQVFDGVTGSGGAGTYKATPAFLVKKGAHDVTIEGFDFTTDDSTFPVPNAGWYSYFASVIVHRADRVTVKNNRFRGGQRRAVFFHGGNYARVENNRIENNGMTLHVGHTENTNFYDAGPNVTSPTFSMIAPIVQGNTFNGYTFSDNSTVLFLSGCADFDVNGNRVLNINNAAVRPILIYVNDLGMTDVAGNPVSRIDGQVTNNIVTGTFESGIFVDSEASDVPGTTYLSGIVVAHNNIRGTGSGIRLNKCPEAKVHHNHVVVTGSPLYLDEALNRVEVTWNHLEGTAAGTSLTSIYGTTVASCSDFKFENNYVVVPAANQYGFRASGATFTNLRLNKNEWAYDAEVASCRCLVLVCAGTSEVNGNTITSTSTAGANALLGLISGPGIGVGSLECRGNKVTATPGAQGFNIYNWGAVKANDNEIPTFLIEASTYIWACDNTMTAGSNLTVRSLEVVNGTLANVHRNQILVGFALNQPGIKLTSTGIAKVTMNHVSGNSSGSLVRHETAGVIETIGNTIVNAGAGGTAVGVSGTATNTAL